MFNINWRVRGRNPVFWGQLLLAVGAPILAYAGLSTEDLTTWGAVGALIVDAMSNPYVLGLVVVSMFNALNDPTVSGVSDSRKAMTYDKPKDPKGL